MNRYCNVCKKSDNLQVCTACKAVFYCGVDHQKKDWPDHKPICQKLKEAQEKGFVKEIIAPAANDSAAQPKKGDLVSVHYTGRLANGYQFDSSEGGDPLTVNIGVGQVIEGWDKGIMTMKVGEKAKLYISSRMAYGPRGYPPQIPPNAPLIFDVELVSVGK